MPCESRRYGPLEAFLVSGRAEPHLSDALGHMAEIIASSGGGAVGGGALSFVFDLLFATGAATLPVESSAENGDDRHDVVCKIFFGGV